MGVGPKKEIATNNTSGKKKKNTGGFGIKRSLKKCKSLKKHHIRTVSSCSTQPFVTVFHEKLLKLF